MIRRATIDDVNILAEFAIRIYTGAEFAELVVEFSDSMRNENSAFFIKFDDDKPVGFAEAGLRFDYVEGTDSSPVGYLEGIYVLPEYRRRGFARALVDECEKWAKSKNCTEFGSDCELSNVESFNFHKGIGFLEANRIICFVKEL